MSSTTAQTPPGPSPVLAIDQPAGNYPVFAVSRVRHYASAVTDGLGKSQQNKGDPNSHKSLVKSTSVIGS